jgi:hypothetical protein
LPSFGGRSFFPFAQQFATITGGVIAVTYPAGSSAPSSGKPGGAQICIPFAAGPATDASLSYDVRFPEGFDWVKGGKLPGLYGGVEPYSGGGHNPHGWSARLMWREDGVAEIYTYIADTRGYGEDLGRAGASAHFHADGKWHHVQLNVHLNTPGHADGVMSLALDGTTLIAQGGLIITTMNTPIGGLFFSTFRGGHDSSWSAPIDQKIEFSHFSAASGTATPTGTTSPPVRKSDETH